MYYLFVVVLEGCPYSNAALELLTDNKTNFKSLKVTSNDKEKYKTDKIVYKKTGKVSSYR